MKKIFVAFSFLLFPSMVSSQTLTEKVLVPVSIKGELPGAFGSLWKTQLTLGNSGNSPLHVDGIETGCHIPPCFPATLIPGATIYPHPIQGDAGPLGVFLYVPADRADDLAAHLRVQDISRQRQTWGTEIPVVRERDAISGVANLLDVPVGDTFRTLIRFYDFDTAPRHELNVRIYSTDPGRELPEQQQSDTLVKTLTVTLGTSPAGSRTPGYAEVGLWNLANDLPQNGTLRIEIEPSSSGWRYWAFASITNNETQHVTIVTPK